MLVLFMNPAKMVQLAKVQYVQAIIIMVGISAVKISIAFSLLRLSVQRVYARVLYASIVFLVLMTIACALTLIFQCVPVQAAWDGTLRPPPMGTGTAKCYNLTVFRNLGLMNSSKRQFYSKDVYSLTISSFQHCHRRSFRIPSNTTYLATSAQQSNENFSYHGTFSRLVRMRRCYNQSYQTMECIVRARLDRGGLLQRLELHRVHHWHHRCLTADSQAFLQLVPGNRASAYLGWTLKSGKQQSERDEFSWISEQDGAVEQGHRHG